MATREQDFEEGFVVEFQITSGGRATKLESHQLVRDDVVAYSFEGAIRFTRREKQMTIAMVPLVHAFLGIRKVLRFVPIFVLSAPYGQMFREAQTVFSVSGNQITIKHSEDRRLQSKVGDREISGDYVDFCRVFGDATKDFVKAIEEICPNITTNTMVRQQLMDLLESKHYVPETMRHYSIF